MKRKRRGTDSPRNFRKTVFSNGLTLVTERVDMKSLAIGIWVGVGNRHEGPRESGISHILEHMLFKGTETRTAEEIAKEVDRVGGEFNAFTAREHTCFHILVLNRDLELAVDILSDVILHSTFDSEELERERKVILQEINMVDESPEELAYDLYFEKIYGQHGLGKPILGTESSVRRITRGELTRFFRKHYTPERTIVSVAGNVSHAAVIKALGALTRKQWSSGQGTGARAGARRRQTASQFVPAPSLRSGRWWLVRPIEQVHVIWGVPGPTHAARDRYAAHLLNVYLGGGMSSVLFQEIREKRGLAYSVYSGLSPYVDSGVFTVYAATAVHQAPLCLRLIEETMAKVRTTLLTDDELSMVKNSLKGTVLLASDSAESRMFSNARNQMFLERHVSVEEICREIDAVSAQEIRRLARRMLRDDRVSVLFLGPRPSRQIRTRLSPVKFL